MNEVKGRRKQMACVDFKQRERENVNTRYGINLVRVSRVSERGGRPH